MVSDRNRKIFNKINVSKLPFKLDVEELKTFRLDVASNFNLIINNANSPALKWCMSTIKKCKVFTLIYQANENDNPVYKEDIAKKLTEYSYKTIATIIDEGIEKGYFVTAGIDKKVNADKKIKNIRPSEKLIIEFLNWSIDQISTNTEFFKKYSK